MPFAGHRFVRKLSGFAMSKPSVYVTRRVPQSGIDLLSKHCNITQWNSDDPIPRAELLKNVAGKDALFCLLTEKIDDEVLDAAGMHDIPYSTRIWTTTGQAVQICAPLQ